MDPAQKVAWRLVAQLLSIKQCSRLARTCQNLRFLGQLARDKRAIIIKQRFAQRLSYYFLHKCYNILYHDQTLLQPPSGPDHHKSLCKLHWRICKKWPKGHVYGLTILFDKTQFHAQFEADGFIKIMLIDNGYPYYEIKLKAYEELRDFIAVPIPFFYLNFPILFAIQNKKGYPYILKSNIPHKHLLFCYTPWAGDERDVLGSLLVPSYLGNGRYNRLEYHLGMIFRADFTKNRSEMLTRWRNLREELETRIKERQQKTMSAQKLTD